MLVKAVMREESDSSSSVLSTQMTGQAREWGRGGGTVHGRGHRVQERERGR